MNKKLKVLSLSVLTSLSLMMGVAKAATNTNTNTNTNSNSNNTNLEVANKIIQNMTKGAVKAEKTFEGPEKNIVGVLFGDNNGHQTIGWLVDNKYIAGDIFNKKGENLTIEEAQKMGLIVKPIPENILLEKALKAPGFKIGNKGSLMLIFEDPNCIFCHKLSDSIEPYIEKGQIQLKIIPVSILKKDSMNKAMEIMESKNPAEAWKINQKDFNVQKEEGGAKNIPIVKNQTYLNIKSNTHLLAETGNKATPTLLVCVHGKKIPLVLFGIDIKKLPELIKDTTNMNQDGSCAN